MFGILLITAVTLTHCYVLWRAATAPLLRRRAVRKAVFVGGFVLWLLMIGSLVFEHDLTGKVTALIELAGLTWIGWLLLLALSLFAVDLVTGFGFLFPKSAPTLRGAALACGAVLSIIAMVQGTRQPAVDAYEVVLRGLPSKLDGTVVVGLSDFHLGALIGPEWLQRRVEQVQDERPDIIVLLGDIFEGHDRPPDEFIEELKGLKAPLGVWAVLGNHEFHGNDDALASVFRNAGISVLRNEKTQLQPGFALVGIDDLTRHRRSGLTNDLIKKALATSPTGAVILLSHTPWNADRAAALGAGLMLCGHTHGGQIWPFGYLVKLFYPLLAGQYNVDGMSVIVSRGAGTWGPRMRLWEPGEILRITLRAEKKEARLVP